MFHANYSGGMNAVKCIITATILSLTLFYRFGLLAFCAYRCLIVSPLYYVALPVTCKWGLSGTVLKSFPSHCVLRKCMSEAMFTCNFNRYLSQMLGLFVVS